MNLSFSFFKLFILHILKRFHMIIFVVVVLGGLIVFVFVLNDILTSSGQQVTPGDIGLNAAFDQQTIDRINKLRTRDDKASQLDLSHGRTNPFVE